MKRYVLGTILLGNLAMGMDEPDAIEKAQLLDRLTKENDSLVPGTRASIELSNQIAGLRKELHISADASIPASAPSETKELDNIIEQMPVEKTAAVRPSAARYGSHPADIIFEEIYHASKEELAAKYPNPNPDSDIGKAVIVRMSALQEIELKQEIAADTALHQPAAAEIPIDQMNQAQIEALIKENTGMMFPPDSDFLKAINARCKELKMWPYDKNPEITAAAEQLPTFDQIPHMTKEQLVAFQEQLAAQEGKINVYIQSQITQRLEELATIERANTELATAEGVAQRALSPKRVHFQGAPSDSDGSGIARPTKPAELIIEEIPAPFTPADFQEDSDFEEKILQPSVDKCSSAGTTLPERKIGTDLVAQPVATDATPLARAASPTEPIETPASRAATKSPLPSVVPQDFKAEPSASPAPDTSGDAALAAKLTEDGKTPGGPDTPKLPIDVVNGSKGDSAHGAGIAREGAISSDSSVGTIVDLKKNADKFEEGETPGGPEKDDGSDSSDSDSSSSQSNTDSSYTTTQKFLIGAGVAAVVYTATETVLAYRSITPEQWKNAHGVFNKAQLVLNKTWANVKSRPTQGLDLLKNLAKRVRAG